MTDVARHRSGGEPGRRSQADGRPRDRLEALAALTADGVFDWDVAAGRVWLSRTWSELVGQPIVEGSIGAADWLRWFGPDGDELAARATRFAGDERPDDDARLEHDCYIQIAGRRRVAVRVRALRVAREGVGRLIGVVAERSDARHAVQMRIAVQRSEAHFRSLIENSLDVITTIDGVGRIEYQSPSVLRTLGHRADERIGHRIFDLLHPEDAGRLRAVIEAGTVNPGDTPTIELRFVHADGRYVTLESLCSYVLDDTGVRQVIMNSRDVSERKASAERLRLSEERYALAARGSNDGLWDWNLTGGEIYLSPRWGEMLGYREDELGASPEAWLAKVHPEDQAGLRAALDQHLDGRTDHFEHEHRILDGAGSWRWMLWRGLAVRGEDGKPYRIAGSQTDLTSRRQAEDQLRRDALYDGLTGLPNRAMFIDRLNAATARASADQAYLFAVLFLDVDRFKLVNDNLGHAAGDELLCAIARRLEGLFRGSDVVARFGRDTSDPDGDAGTDAFEVGPSQHVIARLGGDEFTVLLSAVRKPSDAKIVARRIRKAFAAPFLIGGREVFSSVSVGIAVAGGEGQDADVVLRDADLAMYRAKSKGPALYEVFDSSMRTGADDLLALDVDLRYAIERGQLFVQYQPIVSTTDGRITAFEALVRWRHPVRGVVPPGEFIPLAENSGLIGEIGAWVLRQAARQVHRWRASGHRDVRVAVNCAASQLRDPGFVDEVRTTLAEAAISPDAIELELTETMLLGNEQEAAAVIAGLAELGVELALDDFGTGYSALSYLRRFRFAALKIDRSFVSDIARDRGGELLVAGLIAFARGIGVRVVAEGVERAAERELLRRHRCDEMQGFLFSPPVDAGQATALLARGALEL